MLSRELLSQLEDYLTESLAPSARYQRAAACDAEFAAEMSAPFPSAAKSAETGDLDDYIARNKSDDSFSRHLLALIDQKGLTDVAVYKAAGIDRRHFSKIRGNIGYRPGKATALALCFALGSPLAEAEALLVLAGYSLSSSDTADLIVRFCLERHIYDLIEVNEALDYFGQKPIGVPAQ